MDRGQSLHRFEFHDDSVIDQEIDAESFLEYHPFIFETDGLLSLDLKPPLVERLCQYGLVHRFQQSRAQVTMDAERGVYDAARDVIQLSHSSSSPRPPRLRVSSTPRYFLRPGRAQPCGCKQHPCFAGQ